MENTIKLWRENRVDQEWELSFEEVLNRFRVSEFFGLEEWLDRRLRAFITDQKGLNSVFEEADYQKLLEKARKEGI
jgi:hypothetical protein